MEEIKENLAQDETPFDKLEAVEYLEMHYEKIKKTHLKDLLKNEERNRKLRIETENFTFDYSHENITEDTLPLFRLLANQSKLFAKMEEMKNGVRKALTIPINLLIVREKSTNQRIEA